MIFQNFVKFLFFFPQLKSLNMSFIHCMLIKNSRFSIKIYGSHISNAKCVYDGPTRTLGRYTIAHKCLRSVDIHVEAILTPINTLTNMLGAYIASLIMHAFTL